MPTPMSPMERMPSVANGEASEFIVVSSVDLGRTHMR